MNINKETTANAVVSNIMQKLVVILLWLLRVALPIYHGSGG